MGPSIVGRTEGRHNTCNLRTARDIAKMLGASCPDVLSTEILSEDSRN